MEDTALSCIIFVYMLSWSNVMMNAPSGRVSFSTFLIKFDVSLMYVCCSVTILFSEKKI